MKKKVLILDLDGTLYYQLWVQLIMGIYMLGYYLIHFWLFKELIVILKYRKLREKHSDTSSFEQYKIIAKKNNLSIDKVKQITTTWLISKPLKILPIFKDKKLIKIVEEFKKKKGQVIIYSDYPTLDKLKALNITYDKEYNPTNSNIKYLKPNPNGLNYIIKDNSLNKEDILFIGDRDSKDGECSRKCQIDYIILPKFFRHKKYLEINKLL